MINYYHIDDNNDYSNLDSLTVIQNANTIEMEWIRCLD